MKSLYVFTGAFDCGKTTTLQRLASAHGYRFHPEAHVVALHQLGHRTEGHLPDEPFARIDAIDHLCPMCRPGEFAQLVLITQRSIEDSAADGDLIERGYLDPIEYYERNTGLEFNQPWVPAVAYKRVFLLEVMESLQRPRWGKSQDERVWLARQINDRLASRYTAAGYQVVRIGPGTVDQRATLIHQFIVEGRGLRVEG